MLYPCGEWAGMAMGNGDVVGRRVLLKQCDFVPSRQEKKSKGV